MENALKQALADGQLSFKDFAMLRIMMRLGGQGSSSRTTTLDAFGNVVPLPAGEIDPATLAENSGLRQVKDLEAIGRAIQSWPQRLFAQFEEECRRELGVEGGMPWSLREWRRRQPWGRYTTLARAAEQDVLVYCYLAANQPDRARAQLAQNLRSKVQCSLDGGRWDYAYLLCGQIDPIGRKPFAAPASQMSAIAGYAAAMQKLKTNLGGASHFLPDECQQEPSEPQQNQRQPRARGRGSKNARGKAKPGDG